MNKQLLQKKMKKTGGFTLIEIMISLTLFTAIMIIIISTLISINDANNKAQDIRSVVDNLHFALENVSRSLRTGSAYYCADNLSSFPGGTLDCETIGGNSIAFIDSKSNQVIYTLDDGQIKKSINGGVFLDITSSEIDIENLTFYVEGSRSVDGAQPRVLLTVKGSAEFKKGLTTEFNLQTTISQRIVDS